MNLERLKELMDRDGVSQADLARLIGRDRAIPTLIFQGKRKLTIEELEKISKTYGWKLSEFLDSEILGETNEEYHYQMVPLLNSVPATNFQEVVDRPVERHIPYPSKKKTLIALHVIGESMNRYAPDGSVIIVDKSQCNPSDLIGKPVVVQMGDEGSFKIYKSNPDRFEPYSALPGYEALYPDGEWHIVGRVIGVITNLDEDELAPSSATKGI